MIQNKSSQIDYNQNMNYCLKFLEWVTRETTEFEQLNSNDFKIVDISKLIIRGLDRNYIRIDFDNSFAGKNICGKSERPYIESKYYLFTIHINPIMDCKKTICTLFHELIHVLQEYNLDSTSPSIYGKLFVEENKSYGLSRTPLYYKFLPPNGSTFIDYCQDDQKRFNTPDIITFIKKETEMPHEKIAYENEGILFIKYFENWQKYADTNDVRFIPLS